MSVYKDKNGTWYVMTRCDDWQGQRKQKCKRGFKTKREAQDWERRFLLQQGGDLDMLFKDFYKLYEQDMKAAFRKWGYNGYDELRIVWRKGFGNSVQVFVMVDKG